MNDNLRNVLITYKDTPKINQALSIIIEFTVQIKLTFPWLQANNLFNDSLVQVKGKDQIIKNSNTVISCST